MHYVMGPHLLTTLATSVQFRHACRKRNTFRDGLKAYTYANVLIYCIAIRTFIYIYINTHSKTQCVDWHMQTNIRIHTYIHMYTHTGGRTYTISYRSTYNIRIHIGSSYAHTYKYKQANTETCKQTYIHEYICLSLFYTQLMQLCMCYLSAYIHMSV